MALVNIPIQDSIEQEVTNGLGYNGKIVKNFFIESMLTEKDKKSKKFLKAHLAGLEYRTFSFKSEVTNKIVELTPEKNKYWVMNPKTKMGLYINRKEMIRLGKYLKWKTSFFKFHAEYYNSKIQMYKMVGALFSIFSKKKSKKPSSDIPEFLTSLPQITDKIIYSKYAPQQKF